MINCDYCGSKMEPDGEIFRIKETLVRLICPNCGHQDEQPANKVS